MKDETLSHILITLQDYLYKQKFDLLIQHSQLRKKTEQGFINIIPSVSPIGQACLLEIYLGSRIDPVEQLVNQFSRHLIDFQAESNTVLTSWAHLEEQPIYRLNIANGQELALATEKVIQFLEIKGLAFLEQSTQISVLDEWVNDRHLFPNPHIKNVFHRCLRGMVLAHLNHNPKLIEIGDYYQQKLAQLARPDREQVGFAQLFKFLSNFSVN